jgi:hypothetical protein
MFITVGIASSPNGSDVAHRRMHQRREHEHDPRVAECLLHHLYRHLDLYSERLENVGAAA